MSAQSLSKVVWEEYGGIYLIFERNQLLPVILWCVNSNIVTEIPINDTIYTCILKHNDTISG